jgi:hypothetical protein
MGITDGPLHLKYSVRTSRMEGGNLHGNNQGIGKRTNEVRYSSI